MIRNRQGYANAEAQRKAAEAAYRTCPECGKRSLWRNTTNYGTIAYLRCYACDYGDMSSNVEQIWSDAE